MVSFWRARFGERRIAGLHVDLKPGRARSHSDEHLDMHLFVDNYVTHEPPRVRAWLARRSRYHLYFTPTYSSWVNQLEIGLA